jgi:hypothetical protein
VVFAETALLRTQPPDLLMSQQPVCSFGWWLVVVLICSERKVLLADC